MALLQQSLQAYNNQDSDCCGKRRASAAARAAVPNVGEEIAVDAQRWSNSARRGLAAIQRQQSS